MTAADSTDGMTVKEWLQRIDGKLDNQDKKLDDQSAQIGELKTRAERNADRISSLDGDMNRHEKCIDDLDKKVDGISLRSNILDSATGALAALATILGVRQ